MMACACACMCVFILYVCLVVFVCSSVVNERNCKAEKKKSPTALLPPEGGIILRMCVCMCVCLCVASWLGLFVQTGRAGTLLVCLETFIIIPIPEKHA